MLGLFFQMASKIEVLCLAICKEVVVLLLLLLHEITHTESQITDFGKNVEHYCSVRIFQENKC